MVARREALRGLALVPSLPLVAPSRGRKGGRVRTWRLSRWRSRSVAPCLRRLGQALVLALQPTRGDMGSCATDHSAIGRRPVPSVRRAPRWWNGKSGRERPGTGLRLSPRGSFTPRVSLFGEARLWCSIVLENLRNTAGRSDADSASDALGDLDGHHVRNRTRSTRRRTRFSGALRPRALRAARACQFRPARLWGFGVRETLTASRPSAAIWQLRDGRKTRHVCRVTRWRCAARRQPPTNRRTRCAAPCVDDLLPLWTTRAG
jgi:hypothetical protein